MRVTLKVVAAVCAIALGAVASAKLPPPAPMNDEQKAKAEEAKAKAAEGAKKEAEQLAKAQDRAAEQYKKSKGIATAATKPGSGKK